MITAPKTIRFNLTNKVNNNLKHGIYYTTRCNECFSQTKNKKRDETNIVQI